MSISVFDVFSIGVGPSSSHTVGPMKAANSFLTELEKKDVLDKFSTLQVELFGSLAMTGEGHGTDKAIILGLDGHKPETVDPQIVEDRVHEIYEEKKLNILDKKWIDFNPERDLIFLKGKRLPFHSNAIRMRVYNEEGDRVYSQIYYSVGGGFVIDQISALKTLTDAPKHKVPHLFRTAAELLELTEKYDMKIWELMMENEKTWRTEEEIRDGILNIWNVMEESVNRGCMAEGVLPGGLNVKRRAKKLYETLLNSPNDPTLVMEWVSLYALAVNEENAAGGRIVTSPTNGAAGVIPAVLHYCAKYCDSFTEEDIVKFFLTAGTICLLYKEGASISAAEMGCQGEVGVACSIAAAGLCEILGGTNEQIENAAEIGMEHHLGLTCDPIAGLVQIPCIERNTMGAIKAINAAKLAIQGDGEHHVSLDDVIRAMKQTGEEMKSIFKETSEGGIAAQISVSHASC